MAEYIENPLSGKLRGVTYENGKVTNVHIMDTNDVVKVFVPVRHGRWIIDSAGGKIACSDCGCIYLGYNGGLPPNYCPNCGADMRGSNDE